MSPTPRSPLEQRKANEMADLIGWFAATVLLATIGRQVYSQWRDGTTKGLSRWLFIGEITASIAFVVYSWLLGNWVFVITNTLMLTTAVLGESVLLANRRTSAAFSGRRR
jgi:MtN3 and saliva related transmembrane protein